LPEEEEDRNQVKVSFWTVALLCSICVSLILLTCFL
jgi:hypothetical protein